MALQNTHGWKDARRQSRGPGSQEPVGSHSVTAVRFLRNDTTLASGGAPGVPSPANAVRPFHSCMLCESARVLPGVLKAPGTQVSQSVAYSTRHLPQIIAGSIRVPGKDLDLCFAGAHDGIVKLWDVRKIEQPFASLDAAADPQVQNEFAMRVLMYVCGKGNFLCCRLNSAHAGEFALSVPNPASARLRHRQHPDQRR